MIAIGEYALTIAQRSDCKRLKPPRPQRSVVRYLRAELGELSVVFRFLPVFGGVQ